MSTEVKQEIAAEIHNSLRLSATSPQERTEQGNPRWTLKRLVKWVKMKFKISCCRQTICTALHQLGMSWKKSHQILNKADTKKRADYLERLQKLLDQALQKDALLIFMAMVT